LRETCQKAKSIKEEEGVTHSRVSEVLKKTKTKTKTKTN